MTLDTIRPSLRDGAAQSLPAILAARARSDPDGTVFTALDRDGGVADASSAEALDRDVRRLATALRRVAARGDRVVVPAMPGLDFHRAFLACLHAGLVAVPVPPIRAGAGRGEGARGARRLGRLVAICEDSSPVAAVVPTAQRDLIATTLADARDEHPQLASLRVLGATHEHEDAGPDPLPGLDPVDPASVAFLQYTSGSTSAPRGVMVTHAAMMANQRVIAERYALHAGTTIVSWLPPYHDMGLCAGLLQPLYSGGASVVMEPETFLVRPQRWLEALSHRPDVVSAAPDFAYLLAALRVSPETRGRLDLRGWRMALCGAEPVQATTIRLFNEAFAACGVRPTAFTPAYGLAESTLFVSGNDVAKPPFVQRYDREALGRGVARRSDCASSVELVGAGREGPGIHVAVVDPRTHTRCGDGHVGELWVRSDSNGDGYWAQPEVSEPVFGARLSDSPGERWLRTGDLGFRDDGELVVTGRLKDLIIIRGVNYYPQDFERLARYAHPSLWSGLAAAFVGEEDGERVRIVVEAAPGTPAEELAEAAATAGRAVTLELPVQVEVLVVERGQVPRTTSGKVRRKECAMRVGQSEVLARWPRHA